MPMLSAENELCMKREKSWKAFGERKHLHFATGWCVFQCIGEQVVEYLVEVLAIDIKHLSVHIGQEFIFQLPYFSCIAETFENFSCKAHHLGWFERKCQLVVLHLAKLKQLIDEAKHACRSLLHGAYRLT